MLLSNPLYPFIVISSICWLLCCDSVEPSRESHAQQQGKRYQREGDRGGVECVVGVLRGAFRRLGRGYGGRS
jgi:hypothetical protein